ncbi:MULTISPECIES: hypothetical protein [Bacteroidales]|jgi:lipoprotein|uniref:Bro-N domain-containing protein n=3 Tax=Prevotella TaxID=838 RepID=H1PZE3_9BACT|nr:MULTISPECIES: hypothetical protein [Bacteroidales]AUI56079.1 hypothetical protein CRM71_12200 [Prevotella jejuni]EFC76318.1 hypothetical protein HMPREF0649_00648 [Segatella buccae D17]EHO74988.1 hypothetical protein HMPREF9140_00031 [Prevotella micans F0438]KGI59819.1 hypothetical protein HMPREF0671_09460 [Prevotella sp. S7 MS 2]MBF1393041.1 hypothetical protein [Prevotella histicola]MBF1466337.1 hypothetical protein [Prevotella pallens]QUB54455.1 hypothetical protein J4865_03515 [Prevote
MTMKGKDISSNARRIITIDEHGNIVIPNGEIWMGEFEIADLFGVFGHTIHTLVKKIYRDGLLHPCTAERNIRVAEGRWLDAYSLEMVIALAFRIRSQRAKRLWEHVIAMLNERHERFVMLLPARAGSPC